MLMGNQEVLGVLRDEGPLVCSGIWGINERSTRRTHDTMGVLQYKGDTWGRHTVTGIGQARYWLGADKVGLYATVLVCITGNSCSLGKGSA